MRCFIGMCVTYALSLYQRRPIIELNQEQGQYCPLTEKRVSNYASFQGITNAVRFTLTYVSRMALFISLGVSR